MKYILSLVFSLAISTLALAQKISYQQFTPKDGLPGLQVMCLHQAKDGRLWIGTKTGLSVFDGKHFQNYGPKDGLESDHICGIIEIGDTLVALTKKSIVLIHNGQITNHSLSAYISGENEGYRVRRVKLYSLGNSVVFTTSVVQTLDRYSRFNRHYAFDLTTQEIRPIVLSDPSKEIYNATIQGKLADSVFVMRGWYTQEGQENKTSRFYTFDYRTQRYQELKEDGIGHAHTFLTRTYYLSSYKNRGDKRVHSVKKLVGTQMQHILDLGEYGHTPFGFILLDSDQIMAYNDIKPCIEYIDLHTGQRQSYEFPNTQIQEMIKDAKGNVWMATESGLFKILPRSFYYFDASNGLPQSNLWGFQQLEDQWLVTSFLKGVYMADQKFPAQFSKVPQKAFPSNWHYNEGFYFGHQKLNEQQLVLTASSGSLLLEEGKWRTLDKTMNKDGYSYALCTSIDHEKQEIVSVGGFGIDFFDYGRNKKLNVPASRFWHINVLDIERIDDTRYLVALGSTQAIYDRATDQVEELLVPKGHTPADSTKVGLMTLAKDPQGNIWCGSRLGGQGLFLYKDGKFQRAARHVLGGIVETVAVVNQGRILLASSSFDGLLAIHLERYYRYLEAEDKTKVPNPFYWFDEGNGFTFKQEPQQNTMTADGENRVLFTTGDAKAYYFDIDTTIFDSFPQPLPYIHLAESFNNDSLNWTTLNDKYHPGDTLKLPTNERAVRFEPHYITHHAPNQLRYAYRYRNGKEWSPWKTADEDKLLLTGLDAGYSQLEVKSYYKFQPLEMQANSSQFWVYVAPFWYETLLGKIAAAVLGIASLLVVFIATDKRSKAKEARKQKERTWQAKAVRLEELEAQVKQVKAQEEELMQLQEEVNQYNEELQAIADQFRDLHHAVDQGKKPTVDMKSLDRFQKMPDYNQLMGIIAMVGNLTEKLAGQIERGQLRLKELEEEEIKLSTSEDTYELKRIFREHFPGVLTRLQTQYPTLTPREIELFMLIRFGKDNFEIAEIMSVTKGSVNTNRKRFKKKLGLDTSTDLNRWVREF